MRNLHFARIHLYNTIGQFGNDDAMTLAASLSYYTLFAMPPMLFLLVTVIGLGMSTVYEHEAAEAHSRIYLQEQVGQLIGHEAARQEIGRMLERAELQTGRWWKTALSVLGVLIGATGLVQALQMSLNRIWGVKTIGSVFSLQFLWKRIFSLGMILAFGLLLLVSFVVSTMLRIFVNFFATQVGFVDGFAMLINHVVIFLFSWFFFTAVFRIMPDAVVTWRSAAIGGFFTVVLFTVGRLALFYYLQFANPGERHGTASAALMVIIVWVYYSYMILLFGAAFTTQLRERNVVTPEPGAVRATPDA
jgi:membrane protein